MQEHHTHLDELNSLDTILSETLQVAMAHLEQLHQSLIVVSTFL